MRILMLSWEFPPRMVGGLGRHVDALTRALVAAGHEVHVVAREHPDAPAHEEVDGIHVVRVDASPPQVGFDDFVPWVLAFNTAVLSAASRLAHEHRFDVVHVHDWLVASAGVGVAEAFDLPLVATIHATEFGRHQGHLPGPMNRLIHGIEGWLVDRARHTIVCSTYMRDQVRTLFGTPDERIDVIPNGVAMDAFELPDTEVRALRARLVEDDAHLVLFAGRLEYEKGVQTVLHALERLSDLVGPVRFLVAGVGTYSDELRALVDELGLAHRVRFTGFLEERALRLHYAAADVAVAPSLYEPFGLVAVEAMACGTPVVASDTGGLREIVAGGHGLVFPPQDADQLADRIAQVLTHPEETALTVARARERIRSLYDWDDVASRTIEVYARVVRSEAVGPAEAVRSVAAAVRPAAALDGPRGRSAR
jgi:glycogen synthase